MTKIVVDIQSYIEVSINDQKQVFTIDTARQLHSALHNALHSYYANGGIAPNPMGHPTDIEVGYE